MLGSLDLLLVVACVVLTSAGFARRYRMWRQGEPEGASDAGKARRIVKVLASVLSHRRLIEGFWSDVPHFFVFWGFLLPLTVVVAGQIGLRMPYWAARPLSMVLDLIGFLALTGTVIMLRRRGRRPAKEAGRRRPRLPLWLLLAVLSTGFFSEGGRLAVVGTEAGLIDPWAPMGSILSYMIPPSPTILMLLTRIHIFLALAFIALLPYSNMRHVFAGAWSTFHREGRPEGSFRPLSLDAQVFGAGCAREFSYEQLVAVDACMGCGRCDRNCPACLAAQPLSPRNVICRIRRNMEDSYRAGGRSGGYNGRLWNEAGKVGEEDVWCCTACGACSEFCPVRVGPLTKIMDLRRNAVLTEGKDYPLEYRQLFRNLEIFGDILGKGKLKRENWISEVDWKAVYRNPEIEVLLYVGCIGALYDERSRETVLGAGRILKRAGVDFGILGKEELCCGDAARSLGNEYLFLQLAKRNIAAFQRYGVKEIVTICPHCFHVLHNEYPALGGHFRVRHFAEFVYGLLKEGRVEVSGKLNRRYTYHDPCYLGRHNGVYEAPREILKALLDPEPAEMAHSRRRSLCCGAGGGNFWRRAISERRLEEVRVEEAAAIQAEGIVTACPLCRIVLNSAVRQRGVGLPSDVVDLVDLIAEGIA
jgi:Fe-S oxidoreductase/nitrate reductase gamma subunit